MGKIANNISRRAVLKSTGGVVGALSATGLASGKPDENGRVEVNVGYQNTRGQQAARNAATDIVESFNWNALTLRLPKPAATALRQSPHIRYVEANDQLYAITQTLPWGIDRIDADVAHANGDTGNGADIAIIDTGIDSDHPDLEENLGAGKAVVKCGTGGSYNCAFSGNDNACHEPWDDDNDHGSHCAGIADAVDNTQGVVGVSTAATLHAVKVLNCSGSGAFSDVAKGIEYTADQGWDVGSMSFGGSKSKLVEDAVKYASDKGVLLVAAAGNGGPCSDCVGYPAAESEVIAVSATTKTDHLAKFSSTGPEIELAAPGKDILSTVPGGYEHLSGTSMACPHVSGSAGQLMATGYTHTEARNRLNNTAENIGLSQNESGSGLVDTAAALGLNSSDNLS